MSPVHHCSLKHLVIILTIIIIKTTIVSCAPSYSSFTQINEIADKISADLKKLSREQLCTNVLQNTYSNDAKYISNNVNGTRILEDMAAHVATTIEQKLITPLTNLKNKLEDQYNTNFDFIDKKRTKCMPKPFGQLIYVKTLTITRRGTTMHFTPQSIRNIHVQIYHGIQRFTPRKPMIYLVHI